MQIGAADGDAQLTDARTWPIFSPLRAKSGTRSASLGFPLSISRLFLTGVYLVTRLGARIQSPSVFVGFPECSIVVRSLVGGAEDERNQRCRIGRPEQRATFATVTTYAAI